MCKLDFILIRFRLIKEIQRKIQELKSETEESKSLST